jgi:hypothetical protein
LNQPLSITVSDAIRADVEELIAFVGMSHLNVVVNDHEYWNSQNEWFDEYPESLVKSFAQSALTIVKGINHDIGF